MGVLLGANGVLFSAGATPPSGDAHWPQVASLQRFNGTVGDRDYTDETGASWVEISFGADVLSDAAPVFGPTSLQIVNGIKRGSAVALGPDDFAAEFWFTWDGGAGYKTAFDNGLYVSAGGLFVQSVTATDSRFLVYSNGTPVITAGTNAPVGVPQFYKLSRVGGVLSLRRMNALMGSVADATDYPSAMPTWGAGASGQFPAMNCLLDDTRITVGWGRSETTVPAAPFPNHA